jgi:hypothetical protein
MSKIIKAIVTSGRYKDEIVRVTNVSGGEQGKKTAAVILASGQRANIPVEDLSLLPSEPEKLPETRRAKTASMPFMSGSTGSRSLTQTKNMHRRKTSEGSVPQTNKKNMVNCESCGTEFNQEERKGRPGKLTQCEDCALETEEKMEGTMIFSHKTGATIEIKKDGELRHEAPTFDPKGKT